MTLLVPVLGLCARTTYSYSYYASVKRSLLPSPSTSSLFAEDVIKASLTQMKEDSQLKLLSNLSSTKDGKQSASSASSLGHGRSTPSSSSNSASGLATFMLAKRREGVLSHFPPHVGSHFKKDLASSSFSGPHVSDNEILARVIAAYREDSNLDAQLFIAKAFTLPVFCADTKKSGRKTSSGQESSASSSGFRGRGRGSDSEGWKCKASSPGRSCKKSSRRGSSPACFQAGKRSQVKPGTLPSGDRWLSVPPLLRLEGQRCGALGGGSLEGGVCDSLSHASPSVSDSHHSGFVLSPVHQGEGFRGGDSGSSPQGSGGACTSNSWLLQPHVCCHQGYGGVGGR